MTILAQSSLTGASFVRVSGGTVAPGRDFLNTARVISQAGTITDVDLAIHNPVDARITVKVFRVNGSNYDFIGQSQEFSGLVSGTNRLVLSTGISVLVGDLVCFHVGETLETNALSVIESQGGVTIWDTSNHTSSVTQSVFDGTLPNQRELMFVAYDNSGGTGSISITTESYRIWQRGVGDTANVTIDGTYSGAPAAIERSVDSGAWVTAIASLASGVWADTFSLPTGQHSISYRFSNNPSITRTVEPIAVGDVFACAGQSNISGRGLSNQTFSSSAGGITAYLFGNDDNYKQLADPYDINLGQIDNVSDDGLATGAWVVRFANEWLANNEVPIGFIPCAKGGSSIAQWSRSTLPSTLYGSMKRRIESVGGVAAVLWQQGEADSADASVITQAQYQSALEQLAADIQSDFNAETFVIPLHTISAAGFTRQGIIRQAQLDAASASANIRIAQPLTDIDLSAGDGLHFQTNEQLDLVAVRMYNSYVGDVSDLVISVSGIPDGSYKTVILDQSDNVLYNASATYSSGSATITALPVPSGVILEGYVIDNANPHVSGAVITGTTV